MAATGVESSLSRVYAPDRDSSLAQNNRTSPSRRARWARQASGNRPRGRVPYRSAPCGLDYQSRRSAGVAGGRSAPPVGAAGVSVTRSHPKRERRPFPLRHQIFTRPCPETPSQAAPCGSFACTVHGEDSGAHRSATRRTAQGASHTFCSVPIPTQPPINTKRQPFGLA